MAHLVKKLLERSVCWRRVWVLCLMISKRLWGWWGLWSSRTVGAGDVGAVLKDEVDEVDEVEGEGEDGGEYSYMADGREM